MVFLLITLPIGLCIFGTRARKKGELSAYSVFNKDGYNLPGTTTSEMINDQLMKRINPNKKYKQDKIRSNESLINDFKDHLNMPITHVVVVVVKNIKNVVLMYNL